MFFDSIKEINRLREEINRLLSKETPNIYLKFTIDEKNWCSQKKKNYHHVCFGGAPTHEDFIGF